jgi:hypothetical protein
MKQCRTERDRCRRFADVQTALNQGHGFKWLATEWKITTPGAYSWCDDHLDIDTMRRLSDWGRTVKASPNPCLDNELRMGLIALARAQRWPMQDIAHGMGISPSALHAWCKSHAPRGIDAAIQDFEADTPSSVSAAEAA